MFYEAARFPWVPVLEAEWRVIRDEFLRLGNDDLQAWPEKHLYGTGWDGFGFCFLGKRIPEGSARCPETARLVESIPGMMSAGFSVLQPHATIKPHIGYSHSLLVGHLPLIIPEGCAIRVGAETRTWEPGKFLIFNDMVEHEAWNHSEHRRVVLLVEFAKPGSSDELELNMSGELRSALDDLG